jgi:hypothetical protein
MGRPQFSIGGCCYRMQVDARQVASVAALSVHSAMGGDPSGPSLTPLLTTFDYTHTSCLTMGRMEWLRKQIADRDLTWAVSLDSDMVFSPMELLADMPIVSGRFAMGLAPARVAGTTLGQLHIREWNEEYPPGEYWNEFKACLDGNREICSGGFGLTVFNLDWFREHWPLPAISWEGESTMTFGEDVAFCLNVRSRGGKIAALRVSTDHYGYGEAQTR